MAEAPAYIVANFSIEDAERYRQYEKGFFPILKKYQGEFFSYDDEAETLEGASPREGRMVLFRFPSEALAREWYGSEEYQALSEHRRAGTTLQFLTLVHGLPPRG